MNLAAHFEARAQDLRIPFPLVDPVTDKFDRLAMVIKNSDSKQLVLMRQNAVADRLGFLLSGTAHQVKHRARGGSDATQVQARMSPLGISALSSPGRYMSEIQLDAGAECCSFDLKGLRDLLYAHPSFGASFMSLLLAKATNLVWATRGRTNPAEPNGLVVDPGVRHASDFKVASRVGQTAFFAPFNAEDLAKLLSYAELRLYSANEVISAEGMPTNGMQILFSGRMVASFTEHRDGKQKKHVRTIVRPGVGISWHNGFSALPAPYSVTASRDTSMLTFSAEAIQQLVADDAVLAAAFFRQQLWQIGRYQQTSAGLSKLQVEDEASHLEALLSDNASRLPVDSVLHGVPHSLRNKFTVGHALDRVYRAVVSGNEAERSLAGLMIDALDRVERENRFFNSLNAVYTRVAGADHTANPVTLRELSNADFSRAFEQVPHAVKGMNNLPADPTSIFFYNHLTGIEDNRLANGHGFSLDSHFISAKILSHRYGDGGQRIVRSSRNDEFYRNGYYSRLDNIVVHNRESDQLVETPEQKAARKHKLFSEAQQTFNAGRPLVIAPEGTSQSPYNLTTTSPGPFKPGAFLMAGRLKPEPLLVPIALANFDYPVAHTTYAAVIKPAFSIFDHVEDVDDPVALQTFLDEYREVFRSYVDEARELAKQIHDMTPKERLAHDIVSNVGLVSPIQQEFEADVRELEERIINRRIHNRVVLFGSSTFRLWDSANQDLALTDLINLGFGGATLSACRAYFQRLVVPHQPNTLVLYAGDNDIGTGSTGDQVAAEFELFMGEVAEYLPDARALVVAIKPSPFRKQHLQDIQLANAAIRKLVETQPSQQWRFVDFHSPMLNASGEPSTSFYGDDPLHVNLAGYALLAKLIRDALASS